MTFTALHRALGLEPGPITDHLLDSAVAAHVAESHDLDWKSKLPPAKNLLDSDFPKDVAAMANSGGGVIIYGVKEEQKAATERVDVGELSENHERSLRSAATTAITPPVFGLKITRLGEVGNRAVALEVPASTDGPFLIYKGEYFGAPLRNDADTVWMKERQIEAMYRARFEERRHATEALNSLYAEASAGRDTVERAWLIAVAHPRLPRSRGRLTRDDAHRILMAAFRLVDTYVSRGGFHPLSSVDVANPRAGLRRWVGVNAAEGWSAWGEAWASIHFDGSVSLAAAIGGHPIRLHEFLAGGQTEATTVEHAAADLFALLRTAAEATGNDEYDVRLGIEWQGDGALTLLERDRTGSIQSWPPVPVHRFTPVDTTLNALAADADYLTRLRDFALDCVNQGGISRLQAVRDPAE